METENLRKADREEVFAAHRLLEISVLTMGVVCSYAGLLRRPRPREEEVLVEGKVPRGKGSQAASRLSRSEDRDPPSET